MKAYDIELILSRQLAECLSIPVFITDIGGNLLFYNEPAEEILGRRYEETGEMPVEEWSTIFEPLDDKGMPLNPEDLPLVQTLNTCLPAHGSFSKKRVLKTGWKALPALGMPFFIIFGILGGIFTVTEAAVVAVVYGFIVGMFVYREIKLKDIPSDATVRGKSATVKPLSTTASSDRRTKLKLAPS